MHIIWVIVFTALAAASWVRLSPDVYPPVSQPANQPHSNT